MRLLLIKPLASRTVLSKPSRVNLTSVLALPFLSAHRISTLIFRIISFYMPTSSKFHFLQFNQYVCYCLQVSSPCFDARIICVMGFNKKRTPCFGGTYSNDSKNRLGLSGLPIYRSYGVVACLNLEPGYGQKHRAKWHNQLACCS